MMSSRAFCSNEQYAAGSSNNRPVSRRRRPRRSLSWGAVLAAGSLILAACSGAGSGAVLSRASYGSFPPAGHPETGGVISVAQTAGETPTFIFPITPDSLATGGVDLTFQVGLFAALYNSFYTAAGAVDEPSSVANPPVFSDGDKTVTITLKRTFRWSDGLPVDASDVVFFMDLVKAALQESAANFLTSTGLFPSSISSVTTLGKYTVILHLTRSFNPSFLIKDQLTDSLIPLPSTVWNVASAGGPHLNYTVPANARKIYDYLAKEGGQLSTFATNPLWKVVDGPFKLSAFSATNGSYTLVPNPSYGGSPKARFSALQVDSETSPTTALDAFKAGSIDVMDLASDQVSEIAGLRSQYHASVFGVSYDGFTPALLNFHDATDHFDKIISQPYARQALAHLVDQPAYITGVYKGAAVPSYTAVPQGSPDSPARNPYPYSPAAAARLLSAHGWKVVNNGQTTCERPGTGTGECGAGIPAGTPFSFTWFYSTGSPDLELESQAFASAAKQVGIDVILAARTYNYIYANFDDAVPGDASYVNDWGVSFGSEEGTYADPTTALVWSSSAGYNYGGYSNPAADRLFAASVYGSNPDAVKTELSFVGHSLPALFFPVADVFAVITKGVSSTAQGWNDLVGDTAYQYLYRTRT